MAVHRYKVGDNETSSAPKDTKKVVKTTKTASKSSAAKVAKAPRVKRRFTPFAAIGQYFVGAWRELRQVRWPNRKQTWALTLAVILFSLVLGAIIFLLDLGFTYLFKQVVF